MELIEDLLNNDRRELLVCALSRGAGRVLAITVCGAVLF